MSMIWTPGGMLSTERELQILPPEFLRMLAVLGETAGEIEIGLHCSKCKQDLAGKNARADKQWTIECACRTFKGGNPTRTA